MLTLLHCAVFCIDSYIVPAMATMLFDMVDGLASLRQFYMQSLLVPSSPTAIFTWFKYVASTRGHSDGGGGGHSNFSCMCG